MPKTVFRGNLGAEEKKKHGNNNWYDWSVKNWGSKWDVYSLNGKKYAPHNAEKFILGETKTVARIYFQTAWSPISQVIAKLSEMFPENEFKYAFIDEGDGFAGKETFLAGELIEESEEKSVAKRFLNNEPKLLKGNNVVKLVEDEDRVGF